MVASGDEPADVSLTDAVARLFGILDDFDFNTQADRARALAMLLTPALCMGGWIPGRRPIFTIAANASQTGKGYMLDILGGIYAESRTLLGKRCGGVGSLDEDLAAAMLAGRPFIQLDNLRGKLDSQFLELVLTAEGSVPCRVPRVASVEADTRHFIFTATSNGMDTTFDLAQRACMIRIRHRAPGYSFRAYPEGDVLAHVRANQPVYLGSVFSIIREWAKAGCPRTPEGRHAFRDWAQACDWISQNILRTGPIMDGHADVQADISNPSLVWLRAVALEIEKTGRLGTELIASQLAEACEDAEPAIEIPTLRNGDAEERRKRVGIIMHKLIPAQFGSVTVDVFTVTRSVRSVHYETAQRWGEEKVYRFEKTAVSPHLPHLPQ